VEKKRENVRERVQAPAQKKATSPSRRLLQKKATAKTIPFIFFIYVLN